MPPTPRTLKSAYAHCVRLTRAHYENFPVASVLVPKPLRGHVCAVYAFARRADDFADEARFSGRRLARLAAWERQLEAAIRGEARHPVFVALADTLRAFRLPAEPFRDLLSAFRQDVLKARYRTYADLRDYCRRSADPVGRIVLHLFGYRNPELLPWSDAICTALQLANHWQDVGVDAAKGRIYLPREDMERFGVTEEEVLAGTMSDRFAELLAFQVARTRALFHEGAPLCDRVDGRLKMELKAIWLGGVGILDAIERAGYDVFSRRPAHSGLGRVRVLRDAVVPGRFRRARAVPEAAQAHA
jgi:squalene synthase HpnC